MRRSARTATFSPCRFTNFIAKAAKPTAKSWFVPVIGREQNVRGAVRQNWGRNSRFLPQAPARLRQPIPAPAIQDPAACAAPANRIPTERLLRPLFPQLLEGIALTCPENFPVLKPGLIRPKTLTNIKFRRVRAKVWLARTRRFFACAETMARPCTHSKIPLPL